MSIQNGGWRVSPLEQKSKSYLYFKSVKVVKTLTTGKTELASVGFAAVQSRKTIMTTTLIKRAGELQSVH